MRRILLILLCLMMSCVNGVCEESDLTPTAASSLLMDAESGQILYEKNMHEPQYPASMTKMMSLYLVLRAIHQGVFDWDDQVIASKHAASMGGSQIYLKEGEVMSVLDLFKASTVASANDACVAMAEFVSGSEEAFVNKMNERAKELGMKNTTFKNCNGLDEDGHVISAYDVAVMSRELLVNHPQVHDYCTIWMDTIVHHTAKGSQEFGLSNTNKLIRQYEYSTGLKTGSTSEAGFCVSATAKKGDMELIAVIMNGETSKSRFLDAVTLLNYGYANYQIYKDTDKEREALSPVTVKAGVETTVMPVYEKDFSYLLMNGESLTSIEKKIELPDEIKEKISEDFDFSFIKIKLNAKII